MIWMDVVLDPNKTVKIDESGHNTMGVRSCPLVWSTQCMLNFALYPARFAHSQLKFQKYPCMS